jgi:hypothetical protein
MQNLLRRAIQSSLLVGALFPAVSAHGQAMITAGRQTAFTPFGQMTLLRPDWGQQSNYGYTVGADYTHFIHSRIQPSFEVRASAANGNTVNEHTYLGGFQLQTPFRGIYPYLTLLGGYGGIHYDYNTGGYTGDHSLIYSLGGGADVPIARALRLRLDYTWQSWNIAPQTINPMTISAGFAYTLGGGRGVIR